MSRNVRTGQMETDFDEKRRMTITSKSRQSRIRVMVVDDHTIVRAGLIAILEAEGDIEVVFETGNGRDAVAAYGEYRPSIVLLDLFMPVLDGVEVLLQLKHLDPQVKAIFLSTYDNDEDIARGFDAGASGYMLKDTPPSDLVAGIHNVLKGRKAISPVVAQRLAERVINPELSIREREVLKELVEGLSNKQIAKNLEIATGTVKIHVTNIFRKLDAGSRAEAVSIAFKRGLFKSER